MSESELHMHEPHAPMVPVWPVRPSYTRGGRLSINAVYRACSGTQVEVTPTVGYVVTIPLVTPYG